MRKTAWTLYLWPGLPALWLDGSWGGLAVAVGFGAALNVLFVASYVWVELLGHGQLVAGWTALGLVWLGAAMVSRRSRGRRVAAQASPAAQDLFQSAMTEYLRGHWYDAEAAVSRLVAKNPKDVEARLLWATLLRRTKRGVESRAQLKQLERLDGAATWREEIDREWQALALLTSQAASPVAWLDSPATPHDAKPTSATVPTAATQSPAAADLGADETQLAEIGPVAASAPARWRAA